MFGDSAGGNLAINAAYLANRGNLQSDCGGLVPHTKAVVATYPVVDAVAFYENQDAMLGGFSKKMATGYTGGSPSQYPSRYRSVASSTYLSKEVPPTLILVGEADHLVPPASTYKFAELAKGLGADLTIIRVPYGEHVFDGAAGSVGNQLVRKATLNFLISHQQPH